VPIAYGVFNVVFEGTFGAFQPGNLGVNRIRFYCDGALTLYTEGEHLAPPVGGPGLEIPVGQIVELELGPGVRYQLSPTLPLLYEGILLQPAIGANLYIVGGPDA
jgi:hypothetical protein